MTNWDILNFKVVMASKPAISKATLRIGRQKMSFSALAACEMGYPAFVQMLISEDAKRLVVCPYEQNDAAAIPFFVERYSKKNGRFEQPRTIGISDKDLVQDIRRKLGWNGDSMLCAPLRFKEKPDCLFFDLTQAMTVSEWREAKVVRQTIENYPTLTSFSGLSPIALPQVVNI